MPEDVLFCWSGGKDSAMALHALRAAGECRITALLTTITEEYDRISMHGVRRALLERQAESLGLPLHAVLIPPQCINATYEERMKEALAHASRAGRAPRGVRRYFPRRPARLPREKSRPDRHAGAVSRSGSATRANWRGNLCGWVSARSPFASIRASSMRPSRGASWTHPSSPICRPAWIPAARTANSTRSFLTARISGRRSLSALAKK